MWGRRLSAVREGRESERLSRTGQSAKPLLTGNAQSRARLHRTSLSGSPRRKVAGRATRKCPAYRALSNGEPGSHRRFGKVTRASCCHGAMNRQSPKRRVVHVFTERLSQLHKSEKWQECTTRKRPRPRRHQSASEPKVTLNEKWSAHPKTQCHHLQKRTMLPIRPSIQTGRQLLLPNLMRESR